jgi:copper transport protein
VRRVGLDSTFGRRAVIASELAATWAVLAWLCQRRAVRVRHLPTSLRDPLVASTCAIALALAIAVSTSTHADIGGTMWSGLLLRGAHLLGIGAWLGGLGVLVYATARDTPGRRVLLRAFAPCAAVSVALVTATGLLLTGREVASLTALFSTAFGTELLVKMSIVVAVIGLGAMHRLRLRTGRRLSGTVAVEVVVATLAIGMAAAMGATAPAVGPRFEPAAPPPATAQTVQAADLTLRLELRPNRPGRNVLSLQVLNSRRPPPGPVTAATVTLGTPGTAAALVRRGALVGDTADLGAVDLAAAGPLRLAISVERVPDPVAPVELGWTVGPIPTARPATVLSDRPLAPWLAAGAGLIVLVATVAIVVRRRRHNTSLGLAQMFLKERIGHFRVTSFRDDNPIVFADRPAGDPDGPTQGIGSGGGEHRGGSRDHSGVGSRR